MLKKVKINCRKQNNTKQSGIMAELWETKV